MAHVALALSPVGHAYIAGPDVVVAQHRAQFAGGQAVAASLSPRGFGVRVQVVQKILGGEAVRLPLGEEDPTDVGQDARPAGVVLFCRHFGGDHPRAGDPRQPGPAAARQVGDDHQGFPRVGGAVFNRHVRLQVRGVFQQRPGQCVDTVSQLVQGGDVPAGAEGLDLLALGPAPHADDHRPVHDRVGQVPDSRDGRHREGGELVRGVVVANDPGDVPAALMASVEQAARLLVLLRDLGAEDGVGLVHQQRRRLVLVDRAEDGRRCGVDGEHGLVDRLRQHVQQPRLAAALRRPHHCQPRGVLPRRLEMCRCHPQSDRVQCLRGGRDHEPGYLRAQLVQSLRADRRLRVGHGLQADRRVRLVGAVIGRTVARVHPVVGLRGTQVGAGPTGDGCGGPSRSYGGGIGLGVLGLHWAAPRLAVSGLHTPAAGSVLTGLLGSLGASGVAPPEAPSLLTGLSAPRATTDSTSTPCHSPAFLCQLSAEPSARRQALHAASPSRANKSAVTTR